MAWLKVVADTLTWLRLLLGPGLAVVGIFGGAQALPLAAALLIAGWATDGLDGPLARKAAQPQTWIGHHDLLVDVSFSLGVWLYLSFANWVHPLLAVLQLAVMALTLWLVPSEPMGWAVQGVPYVFMGLLTLRELPLLGWIMVAYAVGITAVTWPRIPQRAVVLLRALCRVFRRDGEQDDAAEQPESASRDAD